MSFIKSGSGNFPNVAVCGCLEKRRVLETTEPKYGVRDFQYAEVSIGRLIVLPHILLTPQVISTQMFPTV